VKTILGILLNGEYAYVSLRVIGYVLLPPPAHISASYGAPIFSLVTSAYFVVNPTARIHIANSMHYYQQYFRSQWRRLDRLPIMAKLNELPIVSILEILRPQGFVATNTDSLR
jgi:hypothetical protein